MLIAAAAVVIAFGTILAFAPSDGFELRIAGVILMLGGVLGLLVPLLRIQSRWSGSTVRSRQDAIDDPPPPGPAAPAGHDAPRRGNRGPTAGSDR